MNFFDIFQIVMVIVVLSRVAAEVVLLRARSGVNAIALGRGGGSWRVVEALAFGGLMLWVFEIIVHALRSRFDPFPVPIGLAFLQTTAARMVGAGLLLVGLLMYILAFASFGKSWRIGIDRKTPGALATGGIFAITRNPIYVAFHLFFIGEFLLNGTWFFLVCAVLAVIMTHFQIRREEQFLAARYGEDFRKYCEHTPRYLI